MVARILHRASQSAEVRADDNEETIKTRIATFSKNTNEILVLYPKQTRRVIRNGNLNKFTVFILYNVVCLQIDAERSVDDIFGDVQNFIGATLASKAAS